MDCEKFEATMIDELYGELDEVTSAASKRHVAGCARCASLIGGLRATRRVVSDLPMATPAEDLEDRILAAARQAQKVVPLKTRVARAVSRAGGWAMRPQTAMAAVFLVMIGMGTMFLRGRSAKEPASSVTVTDRGAPSVAGAAPAAAATTTAVALAETDEQAKAARAADKDRAPSAPSPADMPAASARAYGGYGAAARGNDGLDDQRISNAGPAAGAPPGQLPQASGGGYDSLNAPSPAGTAAAQAAPPPPPAKTAADSDSEGEKKKGAGGGAAFDNAMAAYNAGRYDDAGKAFDTLAANDAYAALWAARAWRDGTLKCRGTVARFDTVAARAAGTSVGYDALLDGATCYRLLGAYDAARDRLGRLLGVPSHEARARAELQKIAPQSNAKAAPKPAAPASTTPAAKQDISYRQ